MGAGPTFVANQGAYLWYRVATGGEGATTTITTTGDFATALAASRWSSSTAIAGDVNATGDAENNPGTTSSPAVTTPALAQASELVIAFAALHALTNPAPSAPAWSTGYTGLTAGSSGTAGSDVAEFTAYTTTAGPAAESPSVSWYRHCQRCLPAGPGVHLRGVSVAGHAEPAVGGAAADRVRVQVRGCHEHRLP